MSITEELSPPVGGMGEIFRNTLRQLTERWRRRNLQVNVDMEKAKGQDVITIETERSGNKNYVIKPGLGSEWEARLAIQRVAEDSSGNVRVAIQTKGAMCTYVIDREDPDKSISMVANNIDKDSGDLEPVYSGSCHKGAYLILSDYPLAPLATKELSNKLYAALQYGRTVDVVMDAAKQQIQDHQPSIFIFQIK